MIALESFVQRKFMTFPRVAGLLRIQPALFTVLHVFFFAVLLGETQSQALNSNLLRDKLKLQWQYEQQN